MRIKGRLPLVGQGTIGGFIGTVCCLLPAAAIALGVTGSLATALVSLGTFRLYGILLGLLFVVGASWFSLRRSRRRCSPEEYRRRRIIVPATMLLSFGAVYVLVMYLVIPLIYRA